MKRCIGIKNIINQKNVSNISDINHANKIQRILPFSPADISELEINEVADALGAGRITTGSRTKYLERRIAEYVGTDKCICLNSQSVCSEMALHLLGIGSGDEVIAV